MFQPIRHTIAPGSVKLQVSLQDQNGSVVVSRTFGLPLTMGNRNMVPISSASNSFINPNTGQLEKFYIVTCVTRSITSPQINRYDTWYLIIDQNLGNYYLGTYRATSSYLSPATPTSTFTRDVCAVETKNGIAFALTGMYLSGGENPDPIGITTTPRTMFIVEIDENGNIASDREYQATDAATNLQVDNFFVNRIIELPNSLAPNDGYMIGGTMRGSIVNFVNAYFGLRVDNSLATLSFASKELSNSQSILSIGDFIFDNNTQEVRIIGTITNAESVNHAYFADKMINVSLPIINLYSDLWNGSPDVFGMFNLPASDLEGYPKVGSLNPEYDARNTVTGSLREGGTFNGTLFTPVLFNVRYDDVSLDNWTTNQAPDIFTYYRIFGSNPGTNYYNALNYNHPWFPDHCSYLFDYTNQQYLLGGLTHDPNAIFPDDYPVLNLTDNQYFNECMFEPKAFTPMLVQLNNVTSTLNINDLPPISSFADDQQLVLYTWFNDNVDIDCIQQQNFKNIRNSNLIKLFSKEKSGLYEFETITGIFTQLDIFDIQGKKIGCQHERNSKISIDLTSFPKGLYLVRLQFESGEIQTFKLTN